MIESVLSLKSVLELRVGTGWDVDCFWPFLIAVSCFNVGLAASMSFALAILLFALFQLVMFEPFTIRMFSLHASFSILGFQVEEIFTIYLISSQSFCRWFQLFD